MSSGNTGPEILAAILGRLASDMASIQFRDVIDAIDDNYDYTPTRFSNGAEDDRLVNEAGSNEGSCKIFCFAKLHGLSKEQTLNCFGDYYRIDVVQNPQGTDHGNIRNFIRHGWDGIVFDADALKAKNTER